MHIMQSNANNASKRNKKIWENGLLYIQKNAF